MMHLKRDKGGQVILHKMIGMNGILNFLKVQRVLLIIQTLIL